MSFKNELERRCYEIAERALPGGVTIEHNKTIQIESCVCQLDLAPFDTLIWPHLCLPDSSRFGPDGRSP
jgi:hypothetical protein